MGHKLAPGAMGRAEQKFNDAQFLARLEKTKPIPIAEVLGVFGDDAPSVFGAINDYQWGRHVTGLVFPVLNGQALPSGSTPYATELMKSPLPDSIPGNVAGLMTRNVVSFEDPLEDLLAADPIVKDHMRRVNVGPQELKLLAVNTYRARRVVAAACVHLEIPYGSEGLIAQIQALSPALPVPEVQ